MYIYIYKYLYTYINKYINRERDEATRCCNVYERKRVPARE